MSTEDWIIVISVLALVGALASAFYVVVVL
jgi:hypothetical protein